jgi:hypothetical protein
MDSHFLNLSWSPIAKNGMAALPIVKNFDMVKNFWPGLLTSMIRPSMPQFHFEGVEKKTLALRDLNLGGFGLKTFWASLGWGDKVAR